MAFRPQREVELFGMSLLDLLCCGLGGMILLFLVLVSQAKVNSQSRGRVEGRQFAVVRLLCPADTKVDVARQDVVTTTNVGEHETTIIDLVAPAGFQPTDRISLEAPGDPTGSVAWITAPGAVRLLELLYQRQVHISPFLNQVAWASDGAPDADAFVVIVANDGTTRALKWSEDGTTTESRTVPDGTAALGEWEAPANAVKEIEEILPAMKALVHAPPLAQALALWAWQIRYSANQIVPDEQELHRELDDLRENQENDGLTEADFAKYAWIGRARSDDLVKEAKPFASIFASGMDAEHQPSGCTAHLAGPDFEQSDLPVNRSFCVNIASCSAGPTGCVQCAPLLP